jgi:hypothetical protein
LWSFAATDVDGEFYDANLIAEQWAFFIARPRKRRTTGFAQ